MVCLAVFQAAPDHFIIFINFTLAVLFDVNINKIDLVAFLIPYGILRHFSAFESKYSETEKERIIICSYLNRALMSINFMTLFYLSIESFIRVCIYLS